MAALITGLDHVLVRTRDYDRDRDNYATLLGCDPRESVAPDSVQRAAFDAGNTALVLEESRGDEGMAGLCFRATDRDRLRRRLQRLGLSLAIEGAHDGAAPAYGDSAAAGVDWIAAEHCRGLALGFTSRDAVPAPPGATAASAVLGLDHAVIASGSAEGTAFLLAARLGLDMRLDLSRPDWDARLLFFRCGDLIIEVFQRLSSAGEARTDGDADHDRFYGLSWRTASAAATRARLKVADFDVSELRRGRKPGTEVFTVRDRSAGVATLMLEPASP